MTDIMMTAWGNFARDGQPGAVKGDVWAPYVSRAPHYMVLDSLGAHELRADAASMEAIFAEVADTDLMTADERCILAWELATALADPATAHTDGGMVESVLPWMYVHCVSRFVKHSRLNLVRRQYSRDKLNSGTRYSRWDRKLR